MAGGDGAGARGSGGIAAALVRLRASRLVRFVVVGGFNTALGFLVYLLLLRIGLPFPAANLGSLVFGLCLGFVLQGRLVFGNRSARAIAPFIAAWAGIYLVQTGAIWCFVHLGLSPAWAGLVALPPIVAISFVVQRHVFARSQGA